MALIRRPRDLCTSGAEDEDFKGLLDTHVESINEATVSENFWAVRLEDTRVR
jgi:hypothetical protein